MKKFLRVLAVLSAVALLQASAFAAINDENTTGDLTTEDIEPIAENQDAAATDNNDATDEATAINNPDTGAAGVAVAVAAVAALGAAVVVSRKKD